MSNKMSWYHLTAQSTDIDVENAPSTPAVPTSSADKTLLKPSAGKTFLKPSINLPSSFHTEAPTLRGMAYGDGFFTTMGVYEGRILWQSYHQSRLISHSQALHLYLPTKVQHSLWQQAVAFAQQISHGILKIIISRQAQNLRGYAFSTQLEDNAVEVWLGVRPTSPLAEKTADFLVASLEQYILQQPPIVATCLEAQLASLPPPLAGLKTLNRLDSVLIAGELEQRKRDNPDLAEGLVKDMTGAWVEGVMSNVFYQLGGNIAQWYTPPIVSSGVCGIMRQVIIDTLATTDTPIQERTLNDNDLSQLHAMFFCNAVRGVIPVKELQVSEQTIPLSLC